MAMLPIAFSESALKAEVPLPNRPWRCISESFDTLAVDGHGLSQIIILIFLILYSVGRESPKACNWESGMEYLRRQRPWF
jgi:hypothetical protein